MMIEEMKSSNFCKIGKDNGLELFIHHIIQNTHRLFSYSLSSSHHNSHRILPIFSYVWELYDEREMACYLRK